MGRNETENIFLFKLSVRTFPNDDSEELACSLPDTVVAVERGFRFSYFWRHSEMGRRRI